MRVGGGSESTMFYLFVLCWKFKHAWPLCVRCLSVFFGFGLAASLLEFIMLAWHYYFLNVGSNSWNSQATKATKQSLRLFRFMISSSHFPLQKSHIHSIEFHITNDTYVILIMWKHSNFQKFCQASILSLIYTLYIVTYVRVYCIYAFISLCWHRTTHSPTGQLFCVCLWLHLSHITLLCVCWAF